MAEKATCPEFKDILDTDRCTENFGGVSRILYAFRKSELAAKLVPEKNKYPAMVAKTTFKTGKGLYKYMCKSGENGFSYESLGPGKGFKQTLNDVIEACDADSAEAMRALNNYRDIAFIQKDGDKGILIYDEDENFEFASGGIKVIPERRRKMIAPPHWRVPSVVPAMATTRLPSRKVVGIVSLHQQQWGVS